MTYPSVSSIGTLYTTGGTDASIHAVSYPSSISSGDLLLWMVWADGQTGMTFDSSFTELHDDPSVAGSTCFGAAYKVATGSESGTVSVTTAAAENVISQIVRITSWHGSLAPEMSWLSLGNSTTPNSKACTPSWGSADTLWISHFGINGGTPGDSTQPTSYTWGGGGGTGGSGSAGGEWAYRQNATSSEDPGAWSITVSAAEWVARTIAIAPSGASKQVPTLNCVDGFEHQNPSYATAFPSTTVENRVYSVVTNAAGVSYVSSPTKWSSGYAVCITPGGTAATSVSKAPWVGGQTDGTVVASFYFRMGTKDNSSEVFSFRNSGTISAYCYIDASGNLQADCGAEGSPVQWLSAANFVVDTWYRFDVKLVQGASRTFDGYIDGVAMTQATGTGAGGEYITRLMLGTGDANDNFVHYFDDLVMSSTAADWPIGEHQCKWKLPTDDSADSVYGTNVMEQGTGTDLSSSNKGYQYLDDWWPSAVTTNNADTVTQAATSATSFVEVEFADADSGDVPWAVEAYAILQSDGTSSNNGKTWVVDTSGDPVADVFSGDMSESTPRVNRKVVYHPVWTETDFNGLAMQVGRSSDAAPDPEWLAVALAYVVEVSTGETVEPGVITQTATIYTPTVHTTKVYAPVITNTATIYTPAVKLQVSAPVITSTATIYTPAVHTTKVYAPVITDTALIYTPAVHTTKVTAPFIDQTAVIYTPTVGLKVSVGALIDDTALIYTPEVQEEAAEGVATPPLIDQTAVVYTPAVHTTKVYVGYIDDTALVYTPAVALTVAVPLIDQTAVIHAPTVQTTKVYAPLIDDTAVIYIPDVVGAEMVEAPFLDYTAVIYEPSLVIDTTHEPPLIDQTAVVYDPSVGLTVSVGALITITPTVYSPSVAFGVSPPLLDYGVIYTPSISTKVTVGAVITRTAVIYTPQVLFPGPLTLSMPLIDVEPILYQPQIHRVDVSQHQHRLRLRSERRGTVF